MADQCQTTKSVPRDVPVSSGLAIAVLSALAAMGTLATNILLPSLPQIAISSQLDQRTSFTKERRMKFYLCKYIPPRADFLTTMTAEESKWMKQHGDFLNNLLDKGLIVAHGPVMDPSGGYGVSLYQISDDQDIATITSEDPFVKNGAGHYEHYPMLHLKSRVTAPPS